MLVTQKVLKYLKDVFMIEAEVKKLDLSRQAKCDKVQ